MNESKAAISDRIKYDVTYLTGSRRHLVTVLLDGEVFEQRKMHYDYHPSDVVSWVEERIRYILKEWPTCQDQTLPSEPKLRRTITISNGQATVTESLCLTEI